MSRSHPLRGLAPLAGTALVLTAFAFQSVAATNSGIALGDSGPLTKAKLAPGSDPSTLPGSILIADEGNNRIYGRSGHESSEKGYLANLDEAIKIKEGGLLIADLKNCRLLLLDPKTRVSTKLGTSGRCVRDPPKSFGSPNGAFPIKGGRYLITEINGDWVDAMSLDGTSSWSTHAPGVVHPSDTSEVKPNVYLTVDFSKRGQIVEFNSKGKLLWRYRPTGKGGLDHTSLGHALPNGDVIASDDRNHRVIVVDPKTNKIIWQYGKYRIKGTGAGYINNPDGLDVLPPNSLQNGN